MSVPNLDSLHRKTNPRAESSGDWRKIKKLHVRPVLTYQELKVKYQFQVLTVRDNRTFNGFLLLIKGLRFRTTKTKTSGNWVFVFVVRKPSFL